MTGPVRRAADEADLLAAILRPDAPVPEGLVDGAGLPAPRRFAVYRNNVAVSLIEALATAFPVVERLVGADFFKAMAGVFVRAHPPRSPLMMLYGDAFPPFLESFAPVARMPYLPDVARLEQAMREAYHAAGAEAVDTASLRPEDIAEARVRFAPATRLVRSAFPIHGIWKRNRTGRPTPLAGAEDVLITRPALDPVVTVIPGGGMLAALLDGATVAEAAAGTSDETITQLFGILLGAGAITAFEGGSS